jgi:uncharacterized protein (DUF736 family)
MAGNASQEERLLANTKTRSNHMATIGQVQRKADGSFAGTLATLTITTPITIVPIKNKKSEAAPDYRVMAGRVELGAGWTKTAESSGKQYVSLSLATPEFGTKKVYANLGRASDQDDDEVFALIWNPRD